MGRVFVAVAALLWAGLAAAVPATPSDIKILESAIDGVEAKNADMYQQANDAKVLEGMYNLSKVESKTVETLKEMASLQEEEKMVRKQFGMEKKGCCECELWLGARGSCMSSGAIGQFAEALLSVTPSLAAVTHN